MRDDYRPREHDHLVEPMFGGLGVERDARARKSAASLRGLRGLWRRLWRALLRLARSSTRASGP